MKFEVATQDAFQRWNSGNIPHTKTRLRKHYGCGSASSWGKFVRAMRYFEKQNDFTKSEALLKTKQKYPNIVLEKLSSYKPTKNDFGARRGPHPTNMQKKRGRKRKASVGTYRAIKKA